MDGIDACWIDECMYVWMDVCMYGCMHGCMYVCTDGWMDGMDAWAYALMYV